MAVLNPKPLIIELKSRDKVNYCQAFIIFTYGRKREIPYTVGSSMVRYRKVLYIGRNSHGPIIDM